MVVTSSYTTRQATSEDQLRLAYLVHFEATVHRHLDYRPPLDWIGYPPFPILEQNGNIVAALACPPDPPNIAWLRLFAASHQQTAEKAWNLLWEEAYAQLRRDFKPTWAAAIPMQQWFTSLLEKSHFQFTHSIVMLIWDAPAVLEPPLPALARPRPMMLDDLSAVHAVDKAAFTPIWQNSQAYLEIAFRQAAIATVAEWEGRLVGYQISTPSPMGGHLARLAVLPSLQGRGIGYALLHDLLNQFMHRGARSVTVNTQKDNLSSLTLYNKAGFRLTGEEYPIYQLPF